MIKELVEDCILKHNTIITSAPGNGTTSMCLFLANGLIHQNKMVLYYNPDGGIDRNFVQKYYQFSFDKLLLLTTTLQTFTDIFNLCLEDIDAIIVDPGDIFGRNKELLINICKTMKYMKKSIIFTSQIRQDPNTGKVYSTLEKINKSYKIFDNSIWITNCTEPDGVFKRKYIDIYNGYRVGTQYKARYLANFTKEGNLIL